MLKLASKTRWEHFAPVKLVSWKMFRIQRTVTVGESAMWRAPVWTLQPSRQLADSIYQAWNLSYLTWTVLTVFTVPLSEGPPCAGCQSVCPAWGGWAGGGCTHRRPSQNKTSYQREASGVPDMRTHSSYVLRKDPMWASKCFMFPVFQALIFQQCNKNSHMWVSWRNEFMGRLRGRRENTLAVWVMGGCGYSCIRVFVLSACVHLGTATDH